MLVMYMSREKNLKDARLPLLHTEILLIMLVSFVDTRFNIYRKNDKFSRCGEKYDLVNFVERVIFLIGKHYPP